MANPFATVIGSLLPEPQAGLLAGILFGTKASLPHDFYQSLLATGTVHLIALSGMNISILIALVGELTWFLGRKLSALVTIGGIVAFILFVGPSASIVRAGIMGIFALLAGYFGRQYWSFFSLLLTSLIMIVIVPSLVTDTSFQLSFLATLGVLWSQRVQGKKEIPPEASWWKGIQENFRLTLYAQLFTSPVLIFHFHRISLVAPLANVLIEWAVQPIMVLGFIVGILGWIWLPLGMIPAWMVWVPLTYLVLVVQWLGSVPWAQISW